MFGKFYLQRRIIALEERVAMLETKQEILLEALAKIKKKRENNTRKNIMKLDLYDLVVPNMSKKAQRAMRKAMKKSDREQRRLLRKYKKNR